ncbi:MAG: response regulator [Desulfobacterales bacterium]|nr:response regulator [Desulfobacterales bacterium]MBF0396262.1 response regulator [Desulfobacterales bacterium]
MAEEEISPKNRAFMPYVRHELRTPINAIIGYSEMLLEDTAERGEEAEGLRADLANICSAGKDLLTLVNDTTKKDFNFEVFGSNFRHAIRTMINTIIGYTEMLLEDVDNTQNGSFFEDLMKIQKAGQQMFKLIEEFIKIEKIETGKESFEMMEDVVSSIRPLENEAEYKETQKGYLLVVDDNEMNRDILSRNLQRQGYTVEIAENGRMALEMISNKSFDLVLLDLMMPEINGYQVLQQMKETNKWKNIPVIMLSALDEIDGVVRCLEIGAEDYLSKPFNSALLHVRIESSLEKKRLRDKEEIYRKQIEESNRHLESRVQDQVKQLRESYERLQKALNGTVNALSSAVEIRDPYTAGHQQRVSQLACAIAKEMGLPESQIEGIRVAGILHDIGKISVPAEILCKPGKISEAEFGVIKSHAETGYDILKNIEFPWPIAQIVRQHQERVDGFGYPLKLSGENILLEAKIIGVADVVEAMATHRPYRAALGIDLALDEITKKKGIAFDAQVVDACLRIFANKTFKF